MVAAFARNSDVLQLIGGEAGSSHRIHKMPRAYANGAGWFIR